MFISIIHYYITDCGKPQQDAPQGAALYDRRG